MAQSMPVRAAGARRHRGQSRLIMRLACGPRHGPGYAGDAYQYPCLRSRSPAYHSGPRPAGSALNGADRPLSRRAQWPAIRGGSCHWSFCIQKTSDVGSLGGEGSLFQCWLPHMAEPDRAVAQTGNASWRTRVSVASSHMRWPKISRVTVSPYLKFCRVWNSWRRLSPPCLGVPRGR